MAGAFFQTILSALLAGTSCSICGASTGTAFLSVYVLTHRKMITPSLFYLGGKTLITVLFCAATSLLGHTIIQDGGLVGKVDVYLIGQILAACVALLLIILWIIRKVRPSGAHGCSGKCQGCRACSGPVSIQDKAALFANGLACGAVPCAPLIMVLGLIADQNQFTAISAGVVFSIIGFISPVLIWLIISRLLAGKLIKDAQKYIPVFQLECYIILFGISVYAIIKHLAA